MSDGDESSLGLFEDGGDLVSDSSDDVVFHDELSGGASSDGGSSDGGSSDGGSSDGGSSDGGSSDGGSSDGGSSDGGSSDGAPSDDESSDHVSSFGGSPDSATCACSVDVDAPKENGANSNSILKAVSHSSPSWTALSPSPS